MSNRAERNTNRRFPSFWRKKVALLADLRDFYLSSDVDQLFASLSKLLHREFRASHVLFSLLDSRRRHYLYHEPATLRGQRIVTGQGFSSKVLAARKTLLFDGDSIPSQPFPSLSISEPIRSALAAPLIRDSHILGTVELINRVDGREFSPAHAQYLDALARHMAISLNQIMAAGEARRKRNEERHLRGIARNLNSNFDLDKILQEILARVKDLIPYDAAAMILLQPGIHGERIAVHGFNLQHRDLLAAKAEQIYRQWVEKGAESRVLAPYDLGELYSSLRPTTQSEMLIPLRSGDRLLGVFALVSDRGDAYSEEDLELLESFGSQASLAIERADSHTSLIEKTQLEQELRIAREIQLRFLPGEMPRIRSLQLAARNVTSRLVSGDYYDLIPIVRGQWGMVVGDVSGKGISAGLIMSAFRAALLAEIRNNFAISTILSKVNRLIWETTDSNRFVTALYGVYDEDRRVLTYSNAGHNPALLLRADGSAKWLAAGGMILGAFSESSYSEDWVRLEPGDLLLLYTDGLTESRGADGRELGEEGVEEIIRRHQGKPPEEIADILEAEVVRSSESGRPEDDATFLIVKVVG